MCRFLNPIPAKKTQFNCTMKKKAEYFFIPAKWDEYPYITASKYSYRKMEEDMKSLI